MFYAKLFWAFSQCVGGKSVANRFEQTIIVGHTEATLCLKDLRFPDAYSREELYSALLRIREHEKRQGWRVPEPGQ
jgi:hypothetical protein